MALDFKAEWGPLPVWAWGAIAGVTGLVGYYVYSKVSGGSDGAESSGSSNSEGANLDAMGYQTAGIKGGQATTEVTTFESNSGWVTRVGRTVALAMGLSPSAVNAALTKYTQGLAITTAERKIVDKAIQTGMAPPEGTQGVSEVTLNSKERAASILNDIFQGQDTSRLIDKNSSLQTAINTWATALESGVSEAQVRTRIMAGGTYAKWVSQGRKL